MKQPLMTSTQNRSSCPCVVVNFFILFFTFNTLSKRSCNPETANGAGLVGINIKSDEFKADKFKYSKKGKLSISIKS